eukprot:CAMPEP_0206232546 /NCGR_PEP_ID=MMETSP0047_2-20121206/11474_1 /ASSEMBLY_ACC=CAM_ASM_000192 /TAXON_ID=195065 /ORGANISM="Chroomonas mesostigmatica_cf, Strain CCMP1168" /LENGTH=89 /DNA_ID=CAMNT_0053656291 /DNA_START=151 /DNA_END=420 /DNA_ORIENTATION=-
MFALLVASRLYMFGWNWAHDANNGMDGNNDACDMMSHDKTLGQDDACLGGWNQHNRFGFTSADQAYTNESSYSTAKRSYTGIFVDPGNF